MTLGTNTKAAIARLVHSVQYLNSEGSAVPTTARGFWEGIQAKYRARHTSPASDPKVDAAILHAEEEISAALDADNAAPPTESTPVVPVESSPAPPLGDLAPAEFAPFKLTARPFPEPVPEPVVPEEPVTTK